MWFFRSYFFVLTVLLSATLQAQDSAQMVELDSVVVRAFDAGSRLRHVAAAVGYLNTTALQRFGTASVVEAVNTLPGLRMEERSPGSYRFNIRGSALRSPFGVRNVKVYYNDLPLTDPSGQTYLNALGSYDYGSVEVIKGPGSSFYGTGTGGVLLINSPSPADERFFTEHTIGSYGLQNSYAAVTSGSEGGNRIAFQHQQSNGYRVQSAMRRNIVNWTGNYVVSGKGVLKTTFLYSDLFYETPGALTANEYNSNRKAARPAAGLFPSAVQAEAAVYQQTFLTGASYTQNITGQLQNKTVAYGAFNKLRNPAIRNYGRNSEPHVGGRTVFTWKGLFQKSMLTANLGAEWQQGFATYSIHGNRSGAADSLQSLDDVVNRQAFLFSQVALDISNWSFTAGASVNQYNLRYQRGYPAPLPAQKRTFRNEVAPRFALLRKFRVGSLYGSVSKGFSSPTIAEAIPTGSSVNLDLNAEQGINYELGFRGNLFKTLYADVNVFLFRLANTIVQRRDAGGGDFYTNAGRTRQHGVEASLRQPLFTNSLFTSAVWTNYTWHRFRYHDFKQLSTDFSGKALPGVAPHTVATGIDFTQRTVSATLLHYYSAEIPLNDANDAFAGAYHLLSANVRYNVSLQPTLRLQVGAGANNLLDQKYSLGNDVNAFGGRYYNAAPRRNYYLSLSFQWLRKAEAP